MFSLSRRTMFSTPMTASSTTTPIEMASPPKVIVLSVVPKLRSTMTAASSDRGIAMQEIAAVRRLNKNRKRTITTKMPPRIKEVPTLPVAASMKVAGRNRSL